jgi:hypothetical protein
MSFKTSLWALLAGIAVLAFKVGFTGTGIVANRPDRARLQWKNAYWVWQGGAPLRVADRVPLLYVQVQGSRWPANLPPADEYVIVARLEPTLGLDDERASRILENYKAILASAAGRARIIGLQIDYDCPTGRLKTYARFLRSIGKNLPPGSRLSITALLDWFSADTAIDSVLAVVDEFVPQFYDAGPGRNSSGIAEPVDPRKWGPIFNATNTPYKIGISSFGRVARRRISSSGSTVQYFRDASPVEFATHGFKRSIAQTAAGEVVAKYEISADPRVPDLLPGDVVEITFPTESSVLQAYEAVRQFGGNCTGALFFRWPTEEETLSLEPADVERIVRGVPLSSNTELQVHDGSCLERHCSDLYLKLEMGDAAKSDRAIDIKVSGNVELFVPAGPLQSLALGNRIRVTVPAYSGLRSVYLGRAISKNLVQFEMRNP